MKSWGSQVDLADELERELSLSHESAGNEGEPLDYDDVISLTSSDPAASALLGYAQKEQEISEDEEAETELSQTSCPAYEELLEVMEHATARLHLPWERTKMAAPPGRLDERYLSGHKPRAQVSLPFLPDLHTEVEREWKKTFSSRIHRFQHTSYANIARMRESGYERMPPVEETLASYLSMGNTASLKVPSLPFKPLQDTSRLNGRAYAAVGQAVASLHTMAVLQAYQADLLKDLDNHHLRHLTEVRWEPRLQSDWTYDDFGQVLCSSNCLTDGPDPRSPRRSRWNLLGLQVILVCKSLGI